MPNTHCWLVGPDSEPSLVPVRDLTGMLCAFTSIFVCDTLPLMWKICLIGCTCGPKLTLSVAARAGENSKKNRPAAISSTRTIKSVIIARRGFLPGVRGGLTAGEGGGVEPC